MKVDVSQESPNKNWKSRENKKNGLLKSFLGAIDGECWVECLRHPNAEATIGKLRKNPSNTAPAPRSSEFQTFLQIFQIFLQNENVRKVAGITSKTIGLSVLRLKPLILRSEVVPALTIKVAHY